MAFITALFLFLYFPISGIPNLFIPLRCPAPSWLETGPYWPLEGEPQPGGPDALRPGGQGALGLAAAGVDQERVADLQHSGSADQEDHTGPDGLPSSEPETLQY